MTLPITQKVVTAPRAQGATTFGMTCYCYGGRIGMNLAKFENATKAVVISHPSLLQVPADFEVRPITRLHSARRDALTLAVPRKSRRSPSPPSSSTPERLTSRSRTRRQSERFMLLT
jgi:dienelactone hydrolase